MKRSILSLGPVIAAANAVMQQAESIYQDRIEGQIRNAWIKSKIAELARERADAEDRLHRR